MKTFWRFVIADLGMILCVVIGLFLPTFWQGMGGRDFRPNATNAAILIFILSVILRFRFQWTVILLVLSLLPIQLITLICIGYLSGYTGFHSFNLGWLLHLNFFIGLPWLLGIAVASIAQKLKRSADREAT